MSTAPDPTTRIDRLRGDARYHQHRYYAPHASPSATKSSTRSSAPDQDPESRHPDLQHSNSPTIPWRRSRQRAARRATRAYAQPGQCLQPGNPHAWHDVSNKNHCQRPFATLYLYSACSFGGYSDLQRGERDDHGGGNLLLKLKTTHRRRLGPHARGSGSKVPSAHPDLTHRCNDAKTAAVCAFPIETLSPLRGEAANAATTGARRRCTCIPQMMCHRPGPDAESWRQTPQRTAVD